MTSCAEAEPKTQPKATVNTANAANRMRSNGLEQRAPDEIFRERDFVDVVLHGRPALERDLGRLLRGGIIDRLAAQVRFGLRHAPRNRRDTAQNDARVAHRAARALDDRRDAYDRVIPRLALADFVVESLAAGLRQRHLKLRDDVRRAENVLAPGVHLRRHKKFLQRDRLFSGRAGDLDLRVERDQRGREIRRVDDVARAAAEDRMIAVVAGDGIADLAALAQTDVARRAKVPAERPLAEIARDGAGVANLRRGGFAGRLREKQ